ncbi:MAG: tRNA pseudouridine(55) synthase TruB [Synergistaceae bacterium]|jgi:tRNA pseudouridine(55) synthase|nr:tRNA pseudouridine(55) synthase TruB [Synergistaceae bacterium]
MPQGILPINKPIGVRSTLCVERVKRALGRGVKVGHGGTLDSTASGVLVLLIGGATRLSGFIMRMPKVYRALVRLGVETTTCDYAGEPSGGASWRGVVDEDVDLALISCLGWRMQVPPKVSAVHVGGRRAHEVFRGGSDPDVKPRPVFVESARRVTPISTEGEFSLMIKCGKGTYVRSIARDIGRFLGCGAHLGALERESIGPFKLPRAFDFDPESGPDGRRIVESLLPPEAMGEFLPAYDVTEEDATRLERGLPVPFSRASRRTLGCSPAAGEILLVSDGLCSVAGLGRRDGCLCMLPEVNIVSDKS